MQMSTEHLTKPSPAHQRDQDAGRFLTERLQLAIYLHATGEPRFLGCENNGMGKVRFVFEDPDRNGDKLELEFDRGAAVPATAIFASQRFLRRKMTEILNNRRIGVSTYGITTD